MNNNLIHQQNIFSAIKSFVQIQEPRTKLLDELKLLITNPLIKHNPFIAIFLNQVLPSQSYGALVERVLINTLEEFLNKSAVKQFDAVGPNGERCEIKYSQSTEKNKTQFNIAQLRENATDNYLFLCINFSELNEQILKYTSGKTTSYNKRWLEHFQKTLSENMYLIFTTPKLLNMALEDTNVRPTISGSNSDGVTTSSQSKRFTVDDIKMREIQNKLREYVSNSVGDYGKNPEVTLKEAAKFYLKSSDIKNNVIVSELTQFQTLDSQLDVLSYLYKNIDIKSDEEHHSWNYIIDATLDCWYEAYQNFKIIDKSNPNFGKFPNINKEVLFELLINDKNDVQYGDFVINKEFLAQNNAKGEQNTDYEITRLRRILINAVVDNSPHAKLLYDFKKQIDSIQAYNVLKDRLLGSCDTLVKIMNNTEFNVVKDSIIKDSAELEDLKKIDKMKSLENKLKKTQSENLNLTNIINGQTEQLIELEHNFDELSQQNAELQEQITILRKQFLSSGVTTNQKNTPEFPGMQYVGPELV